ncbi:MAG: M28 family peptidase [Planctomycetota bacterium]
MPRFLLIFCFSFVIAQQPVFKTVGTLEHPHFSECSGIDVYLENGFVGLNDSGNAPQIFAFDQQGKDLGVFDILGVQNIDWEDLIVEGNTLYIGDVGDNLRTRKTILIHQVELPSTPPGTGKKQPLPVQKTWTLTYPDAPHDCEALFFRQGQIYLITKNRGDLHQCFVVKESQEKAYLEKCGDISLDAIYQITAADYQENQLVIATYWGWMIFPEPLFSTAPVGTLYTKTKQLESICFYNGHIFWTGEYRELFIHPLVTGVKFYLPERMKKWIPFSGNSNQAQLELIPRRAKIGWNEEGLLLELYLKKIENRLEEVILGWDAQASFSTQLEQQSLFVIGGKKEKIKIVHLVNQQKTPLKIPLQILDATDSGSWIKTQIPLEKKLQPSMRAGFFLSFESDPEAYFGVSWNDSAWDRPYQWGEILLEVPVETQQLQKHVEYLSQLNPPRNYRNLDSLRSASEYLRKEWEKFGFTVTEQEFQVDGKDYKNLSIFYGPEEGERLVIGAHYDVCGNQPGADDNASGVAGLLEISRLLSLFKPQISSRIELVAYTLEEPPFFRTPFMGSAIHAQSLLTQKVSVKAMISLEMIGYFTEEADSQKFPIKAMQFLYPNTGNFIAIVGNSDSYKVAEHFKKQINQIASIRAEALIAPSNVPGVDFSDHLNYWNYQMKAIMITDTSFYRNANYHKNSDTPETLNYPKMAEVVKGIYGAILCF